VPVTHALVSFELVGPEESDATGAALVQFEVKVCSLMIFLVTLSGKFLTAESAGELLFTGMKLHMVDQTGFVLENFAAFLEWALVAQGVTDELILVLLVQLELLNGIFCGVVFVGFLYRENIIINITC
jgi:hypothetical protein